MKPLFWDDFQAIKKIEHDLREGNVVLAGGDTVFGLLADVSEKGYAQLDSIKNRSKKPYLLLVENKAKALDLIAINENKKYQIEKIINICWPGPATLIFKAKEAVPAGVKSEDGNVAIRVPNHEGLLKLLHHFDALYSTSANTSGNQVPALLEDVEETILQSVASIILNKNEPESVLPSTIIDCSKDVIKVVRNGAFPIEKISEFLE